MTRRFMHRPRSRATLCLALATLAGCNERSNVSETTDVETDAAKVEPHVEDTATRPWFEERSRAAGVSFVHASGHQEDFYLPEIMSGGVAAVDLDGDGWLDLYFVQSGDIRSTTDEQARSRQPGNVLYRNRGDGTFEDVSDGSGADDRGYGMGVAAGDYDGDGDLDLYVCNVGANVLLRNDRDGDTLRFTDVTAQANVGDDGFGSSSAFLDYDRDGDLDLFVLNYLNWSVDSEQRCFNTVGQPDYCSPAAYNAPAMDVLYRNNGDGTFTDVSEETGITASFGTGLGIVAGDFDGDGWTDVFIANDGRPDQLWMNQGDLIGPRFVNRANQFGVAIDQSGHAKAGMGVAAADVDMDGDLDVLVCNLRRETDSLYLNENGYFQDATAASGLAALSRQFTRFGIAWADFDNDGLLDIYQANGRVATESDAHTADDPFAEPNLLLQGMAIEPRLAYQEIHPRGGTQPMLIHASRAAAFGDLNNDGGMDIVVINRDAPAYLLINVAPEQGDWLTLDVRDEHGAPALGASVSMEIGGRPVIRSVRSAYSYCAANDPRVHVGLGHAAPPTSAAVTWTDGYSETFSLGIKNEIVMLRRGNGVTDDPRSSE